MSHPPIVLHGAPNGKPIIAAQIIVVRSLVSQDTDAPDGAESFVRFQGDEVGEGWFVRETVEEIANLLEARSIVPEKP